MNDITDNELATLRKHRHLYSVVVRQLLDRLDRVEGITMVYPIDGYTSCGCDSIAPTYQPTISKEGHMSTLTQWTPTETRLAVAQELLRMAREGCPTGEKAREILGVELALCGVVTSCPNAVLRSGVEC